MYTADPNVVFTKLEDDEAVLLHLITMRYYSLNETGTFIWEQFEKGGDVSAIAGTLQEVYEVSDEDARESVREFFDNLVSEGLVQSTGKNGLG